MAQMPVIKNSIYSREQLENVVADILAEARAQGATAAEAAVSIESGLSVTARLGEVETVEHNHDKGLGVTVYVGQVKGSASTSDFADAAIKDTVAAACRIARYTAADEYAGLADAALRQSQSSLIEVAKELLENHKQAAAADPKDRQGAIDGLVKPVADTLEK